MFLNLFTQKIDIVTVIKKSDRQNMNLPKMVPVLKSALNFDFEVNYSRKSKMMDFFDGKNVLGLILVINF